MNNFFISFRQWIRLMPILLLTLVVGRGLAQTPEQNTVIYPPVLQAEESQEFAVRVNGESVFVEFRDPTDIEQSYEPDGISGEIHYHYAQFAFQGQAEVEITGQSDLQESMLAPKHYNLAPEVRDNTLTFTLNEPKDVVLKVGSEWLYILADPIDTDAPRPGEAGVVNIQDYEVDSTGQTLNTYEIQKAIIDLATGPHAGGTLFFPPGVYKTGTLEMYSNVSLYLSPGAVLRGSDNPLDYPLPFGPEWRTERKFDHGTTVPPGPPDRDYGYKYALLKIHHASNVQVRGAGIIEAPGGKVGRLKLLHIMASENVTVRDVTLRHGHGWMFPVLNAQNVTIENVKLLSAITSNTDGINPDASSQVLVDGAFIVTGDDAVAVKSTNFGNQLRKEVRDITVKNSLLMTVKSALKIGTETRSDRYTNIHFRNNSILTSDRAFVIYLRDGALVENIYYSGNHVEQAGGITDDNNKIIDVSISKRDRRVIWQHPEWEKKKEDPGRIRNLVFEDIEISTERTQFLTESNINGYNTQNNISGVTFRNIYIDGEKVDTPEFSILYGDGGKTRFLKIDSGTTGDIWFHGRRITR